MLASFVANTYFMPQALLKAVYSCSWESISAAGRHLPYGITHCYLPPDTSERARRNPSHPGRYLIYLPRKDGRLS